MGLSIKDCKHEIIMLLANGASKEETLNSVISQLIDGGICEETAKLIAIMDFNIITKDIIL